jgi:hypothetical protein
MIVAKLGFNCAILQFPKLCGYYKFQREYFEDLQSKNIVIVCIDKLQDMEEEGEQPMVVQAVANSTAGNDGKTVLELKMENLSWKLNMSFVFFATLVVGIVVGKIV